jgi:hypothetical protein
VRLLVAQGEDEEGDRRSVSCLSRWCVLLSETLNDCTKNDMPAEWRSGGNFPCP